MSIAALQVTSGLAKNALGLPIAKASSISLVMAGLAKDASGLPECYMSTFSCGSTLMARCSPLAAPVQNSSMRHSRGHAVYGQAKSEQAACRLKREMLPDVAFSCSSLCGLHPLWLPAGTPLFHWQNMAV